MNYPDSSLVSPPGANEVRRISQMWKVMGHSSIWQLFWALVIYITPISLLLLHFQPDMSTEKRGGPALCFMGLCLHCRDNTGTFWFVKTAPVILHRAYRPRGVSVDSTCLRQKRPAPMYFVLDVVNFLQPPSIFLSCLHCPYMLLSANKSLPVIWLRTHQGIQQRHSPDFMQQRTDSDSAHD